MTTLEIIELCILAIAILAVSIYVLIKGIKEKWFSKILKTIEEAIKEAEEKYPETGKGDEKKQYVIDKVKEQCKELNIPYELLKKLIDIAIDKIIKDYNVIAK